MLDFLVITAIVMLVAILALLYLEMADVVVDLMSSLLQLAAAVAGLTMTLLAMLIDAIRRLLKKQHNAIIP